MVGNRVKGTYQWWAKVAFVDENEKYDDDVNDEDGICKYVIHNL